MVASASEQQQVPAGIPAWRIALGNIAAGATAGATVEAGSADTLGYLTHLQRIGICLSSNRHFTFYCASPLASRSLEVSAS